jgi:hypothetical protein
MLIKSVFAYTPKNIEEISRVLEPSTTPTNTVKYPLLGD